MHIHETARKRASRGQDIHRNQCAPPAAEETQIQNQPLRPARRSDFGTVRRPVDQVYLGSPETPIRARNGSGLAEISAMQGFDPPEACRRVSLEIDFSGLRGGAISALAVDQVYLGGIYSGSYSPTNGGTSSTGNTLPRTMGIEYLSHRPRWNSDSATKSTLARKSLCRLRSLWTLRVSGVPPDVPEACKEINV